MFSIISWCDFVSQENDLQYNHLTDRLSICKVSEQIWPHLWVPSAGRRELPAVGRGPRSPLSPLQPAAASGTTLLAGAPRMLARPSRCPVQNCSAIFTANQITFYILVKAIYTLGYSVSLISLTTGSIILCLFRKLHCTRNYIHLNLFLSFILRAVSVLVKDDVLYSSSGMLHCLDLPSSWVGCKLSLVFFQYCIMANFYWLLVEGLYLHTLLAVIFAPGRRFRAYLLIGWGIPTVCTGAWTVARLLLEDTGCWDTNDHSVPWWVIRTPILISIIVNFILFVSIIRILLQKLTSPDVGGNDQSQYKRLAKSTLLLIPLFGVHYMVFAVFPIRISSKYQILFELCLGSFQGLVVAVLYCFLNSEVQSELRRTWRGLWPSRPSARDYRLHSSSISRTGSDGALQGPRGSRAPSLLQTETSVI
uniref:Vasoactive intestinal peptide receptor 2 n=1 Tax=Bos indicus x Bos taurus TaxID=30522 RepID=A0A4W2EU19_BOBOX